MLAKNSLGWISAKPVSGQRNIRNPQAFKLRIKRRNSSLWLLWSVGNDKSWRRFALQMKKPVNDAKGLPTVI